ncbi:inorganic triphosphatase [Mannheimia massilioguelmaensis]|uniref:CYTH domain-containing protein n=1 Tax=Mannheimia massilioguelmaensis TaxID=1604354 RepID=UPI0005C9D506|nr:inorganic triphosphatase [Mannheimia massilioguelmaensis]
MSNEIELKLAVNQQFAEVFAQEITNFHIIEHKKVFLGNCYYDSSDCYFAQRKMGLRVRTEDDKFTMTLKTDGKVTGGLHIRPEYNIELDSMQPDLTKLSVCCEELFDLPKDLQVQPIFSTDFERQFWLVECGHNSEVEIALDLGEIKAGKKIEAISEVEFELKHGDISELLTLVSGLSLTDGIRLSSASKAKRGYQLAKPSSIKLVNWLEQWRDILKLEASGMSATNELAMLFTHEQQLIEETVALRPEYFALDFIKTVERIGSFFNLYHHYAEQTSLFNHLINEKANIDESILAELAESNTYLYEQIRNLIRFHSETKDNLQAMQKLHALLHRGEYVRRMINLIRLTLD